MRSIEEALKSLTLKNGYLDMERIITRYPTYPFVLIVGGRGTGKTYGTLKYVVEHPESGALFLRKTQDEHDMISQPEFSPFLWHNRDFEWSVEPFKKNAKFTFWYQSHYEYDEKKEREILIPDEPLLMKSTSLHAIAKIRGFNGSDIKLIIYDEFIPQSGVKKSGHYHDFFNAYETINRNRELEGEPPLKALLLSNSNSLANDIFEGFGIVELAEKMKRRGEIIKFLPQRGILLIILPETEISRKKKDTALYRATSGTEFSDMALSNDFAYDKPTIIESRNLGGYSPVFITWSFSCWRNRNTGEYYISKFTDPKNQCPIYSETMAEIARARKKHKCVMEAYIRGRCVFETYATEINFKKFFLDNIRNL